MAEPVFSISTDPPPEDEPLPQDIRGALLMLHKNITRNCRLQAQIYRVLASDPLDPSAPKGMIHRLSDLEIKVDEHTRRGVMAPDAARKRRWNQVWIAAAIGAATVVGAGVGAKITTAMGWGAPPAEKQIP